MTKASLRGNNKQSPSLRILFSLLLVVFAAPSCAPHHAPVLPGEAEKYRPVRIAAKVQTSPGGFGWSGDGGTLAYIAEGKVILYDTASGARREVSLEAPHFLRWSADGKLFVLVRENGKDLLRVLDGAGRTLGKTELGAGAEAIYPTADNKGLILLTLQFRQYSFGSEIAQSVSLYSRDDGTSHSLYGATKSYPARQIDLHQFLSWTHAGLNPIDNSVLVFEHIKPPAFPLYSRVIAIDTLTGAVTGITSLAQLTMYTSGSWSPDGKRLALSDVNGGLEIYTLFGSRVILDRAPAGFPAWNPQGDRLYAGGYLVDPAGGESEALLPKDLRSIAAWALDGTKLAAATSGGDLWLFSGISPAAWKDNAANDSLRKKIRLLQDLLRDRLITPEDYLQRKSNLLRETEHQP